MTMRRIAGWIGGIALLAAIGAVVGVRGLPDGRGPHTAPEPVEDARPAASTPAAAAQDDRMDAGDAVRGPAARGALRTGANGAPLAPLPPPGAPLAGVMDDLERRARSGDARAACRLAAEIGRCAGVARREAMVAASRFTPPAPGVGPDDPAQVDRFVDLAARQQVDLERDQALCAGVSSERLRDAAPWMLVAARGGNAAAMAAFASGMWMNLDPYAMRHPDVLAAYSREAERMALALVESGSPAMVRMLGMAYAGAPGGPLGGVVDPDPVRGHALLRLLFDQRSGAIPDVPLRRSGDAGSSADRLPEHRAFEALDARLDPGQRAASDAMFARLSARRAEHEARAGVAPRPTVYVNSMIQPDACDR